MTFLTFSASWDFLWKMACNSLLLGCANLFVREVFKESVMKFFFNDLY